MVDAWSTGSCCGSTRKVWWNYEEMLPTSMSSKYNSFMKFCGLDIPLKYYCYTTTFQHILVGKLKIKSRSLVTLKSFNILHTNVAKFPEIFKNDKFMLKHLILNINSHTIFIL